MIKTEELDLITIKNFVVLPDTVAHLDISGKKSVAALIHAHGLEDYVFISGQINDGEEILEFSNIENVGTVCRIKSILQLPGNVARVLLEGVYAARLIECYPSGDFYKAKVLPFEYFCDNEIELEALDRKISKLFTDLSGITDKISRDKYKNVMTTVSPNARANKIAEVLYNFPRQVFLDEEDMLIRLEMVAAALVNEIEIAKIDSTIIKKINERVNKNQKDFYLREQLKVIREELGDVDEDEEELIEKANSLKTTDENKAKILKHIKSLQKMQSASAEASILRNYIDLVFELPWGIETEDTFDIKKAKNILNEDHYGIDKVKERILEYLSVRALAKSNKGSILCLSGPPGIGKTSIAKSIARALGRKYTRISLGAVKDEAEIRGHRRTYIGSMPGRIITAIKNAGSVNPVILLDEIDKINSDIKGDPSSALLEVLDPEQNKTFRDNYLELPFDLSKVLFIATANTLQTVSPPLLDRMEVIEMTGYTYEEKAEILKHFIFPKQKEEHGLGDYDINLTDEAINDMINYYTRESGVRGLERQVKSLCRKIARKVIENPRLKSITIDETELGKLLGVRLYDYNKVSGKDEVGSATGLAWTSFGGDTLSIEVTLMNGKGDIILTGHLGDVMKESARTAISLIKANSKDYGIDEKDFEKTDIHIHVPEGAVPKDGPSAGITIATAVLSAFTGRTIKSNVAMTGEITLRGKVLPIGGLKEKLLAAYRAGIDTVILPEENQKDMDKIPKSVLSQLHIIYADNINTVFRNSLNRI